MRKFRSAAAVCAAIVLAGALSACTANIPFIGEVSLPDPSQFFSGFGSGPSVEEYESQVAAARTPLVSTPALHEDGVLTVGINFGASSAPFAYREADGTVRGMDAELAYVVGDALGLDVRFVDAATQASQADVVMDVGISKDGIVSVQGMQTVGNYAESAVGLFYQGTEPLADAYMLEGKKVGVQLNSISHAALQKASVKIDIRTFSNLNDAFAALDAGELDYVSCPVYPGAYLAAEYKGITCGGTFNVPTGIAMAVNSNNAVLAAEISRVLEEVRANGLLDLVRSHWVGSLSALTASSQLSAIDYVLPGVSLDGDIETVTPMGEPTAGANAAAAPPQSSTSSSSNSSADYSSGYGTSTYGTGTGTGTNGYDNSYGGYSGDGGYSGYDAGGYNANSYDANSYDNGGTYDGSTSGGGYDSGSEGGSDGSVYSAGDGSSADGA